MSLKIELLEQSLYGIQPHAEDFMNSFYKNLFAANPEVRSLFETTKMEVQKKKFLGSLVLVVKNLRNLDILDKAIRGLGARHVKYGVLPKHYPLMGNALLTTFEEYLADFWTPENRQAWIDIYGVVTEMMLDGAEYSEAEIALSTTPPPPATAKIVELNLPIELLEITFKAIQPNANYFANSFYKNLFAVNPQVKPLFDNGDIEVQKKNLLDSLTLIVENLRSPKTLNPILKDLGNTYAEYGALPEHYPTIADALSITLKQYLGASWTPEIKQAWVDACSVISEIMLDGIDYSEAQIALATPSPVSGDQVTEIQFYQ